MVPRHRLVRNRFPNSVEFLKEPLHTNHGMITSINFYLTLPRDSYPCASYCSVFVRRCVINVTILTMLKSTKRLAAGRLMGQPCLSSLRHGSKTHNEKELRTPEEQQKLLEPRRFLCIGMHTGQLERDNWLDVSELSLGLL